MISGFICYKVLANLCKEHNRIYIGLKTQSFRPETYMDFEKKCLGAISAWLCLDNPVDGQTKKNAGNLGGIFCVLYSILQRQMGQHNRKRHP